MYQPHLNMSWGTYPVAPPGGSFYFSPQHMPYKMSPHNLYGFCQPIDTRSGQRGKQGIHSLALVPMAPASRGPHLVLSPVGPQGPPMEGRAPYPRNVSPTCQHRIYQVGNQRPEYQKRDPHQPPYYNGSAPQRVVQQMTSQNGSEKGTVFLSLVQSAQREPSKLQHITSTGNGRELAPEKLSSPTLDAHFSKEVHTLDGSPTLKKRPVRLDCSVVLEDCKASSKNGSLKREARSSLVVAQDHSSRDSCRLETPGGRKRAASPVDSGRNLKRQRDVFLQQSPESEESLRTSGDRLLASRLFPEINKELSCSADTLQTSSQMETDFSISSGIEMSLLIGDIGNEVSATSSSVGRIGQDNKLSKIRETPEITVEAPYESLEKEPSTKTFQNNPSEPVKKDMFYKEDKVLGRKLTADILSIYGEYKQTEEVFSQKIKLRNFLYHRLLPLYPSCGLYMVGSSMTGLAAQYSDLDLCLMLTDKEMDQQSEALVHLRHIFKSLRLIHFIKDAELIYAKVPILKFKDEISKVEVDLNVNNTVGIRNTQLLNCYSKLDERVPQLCLLVKLWARSQDINDPFNMTLSSYSLILMVLHFLQCGCDPPVLPCLHNLMPNHFGAKTDVWLISLEVALPCYISRNDLTPGELFIRFLHYFGFCFDFKSEVMCVRTGGTLPKEVAMKCRSPKNRRSQWNFIGIEEPFDQTNTARSVYNQSAFQRILKAFQDSLQLLRKTKDLRSLMCSEGIP